MTCCVVMLGQRWTPASDALPRTFSVSVIVWPRRTLLNLPFLSIELVVTPQVGAPLVKVPEALGSAAGVPPAGNRSTRHGASPLPTLNDLELRPVVRRLPISVETCEIVPAPPALP